MAAIVARNERYHVYGHAHGFYDAGELIRKHQPYVLLIEFALLCQDLLQMPHSTKRAASI